MRGLYIHIPFCRKACTYCDFHFSTNLEKKGKLVDAICKEIVARKNFFTECHSERSAESQNKLSSIYFGGGTPSTLSIDEVKKILDIIHASFDVDKNAEITFELNPEDADPEYLKEIRKVGVNRLSIGLQSFNDEELQWMNREHSAQQSVDCVANAKKAGFENISIDLIYGSKFQNEESWIATLQKVFDLDVPHISSYNLTIEGKTKLNHLLQQKAEPEIDSELSSRLFDILMEETAKNSFEHYEISNFCKPGSMAVHNSSYWKDAHYLGVGPAAHSYNGISRRFNVRSNAQYMQNIEEGKSYYEEEILTDKDKYNEYVLTRLRTNWGCDLHEMEKLFEEKFTSHFKNGIQKQKEYIIVNNNSVTLNKQGKHFADGIAADLFY
jgi:oxygen-independent coproporphyrinogen III oxidase